MSCLFLCWWPGPAPRLKEILFDQVFRRAFKEFDRLYILEGQAVCSALFCQVRYEWGNGGMVVLISPLLP